MIPATVMIPTANWPAVPWRVFASSTVSWRRKCQPSRRSSTTVEGVGAASSPVPLVCPAAASSAAPAPRARRITGGTIIVAMSAADARYVAASNQNATGSDDARNTTNSPASG